MRWYSILFLLSALFATKIAVGDQARYCGVYAVYGAASALKVSADFETLLDTQYVSTLAGSTADDLVRAADRCGLHAEKLGSLGVSALQRAHTPLILHVSSVGQFGVYDHWMLFLGMEALGARVVDSSEGIYVLPLSELLARWDGFAISITKPDTLDGSVSSAEMSANAATVVFAVVIFTVTSLLQLQVRPKHRSGFIQILVSTLLCAVATECYLPTGFARNQPCVLAVNAALGHKEFPTLTADELRHKLQYTRDELLLLDVRFKPDFDIGHIDGAINLPVITSQKNVIQRLDGISRSKELVVYCQSASCGFSDRIAVALSTMGFHNVAIFRDGWAGWLESAKGQP